MNKSQIEAELTRIFRATFDAPELNIRPDMTAADVENWTSLTHNEMLFAVEKQFGVKMKLKEQRGLRNVGDLVDLLEAKLTGE